MILIDYRSSVCGRAASAHSRTGWRFQSVKCAVDQGKQNRGSMPGVTLVTSKEVSNSSVCGGYQGKQDRGIMLSVRWTKDNILDV